MTDIFVQGLSVTVIVTIVFALYNVTQGQIKSMNAGFRGEIDKMHGIVQQQLRNLQERLEAEAVRLKDNTDKAERRLDDCTRLAELRLKEETTKAEARLAESFVTAEHRRKEQLTALEEKFTLMVHGVDKGLRSEISLQFVDIQADIAWLKDRIRNGLQNQRT